ncbi:hypothetical protein FD754_008978, partial [Muntiacus muntjak]
ASSVTHKTADAVPTLWSRNLMWRQSSQNMANLGFSVRKGFPFIECVERHVRAAVAGVDGRTTDGFRFYPGYRTRSEPRKSRCEITCSRDAAPLLTWTFPSPPVPPAVVPSERQRASRNTSRRGTSRFDSKSIQWESSSKSGKWKADDCQTLKMELTQMKQKVDCLLESLEKTEKEWSRQGVEMKDAADETHVKVQSEDDSAEEGRPLGDDGDDD